MGSAAIGNRQFETAQQLLWQCVMSEGRQPQDVVNLSLTYRALKNYDDGRRSVDAALKQTQANEDLHYVSAYLFFRTQQYQLSIQELRTAYLMKQNDWRIHQLFALNFTEEKAYGNAEQEFIRAIRLNRENAELYYQLARLYYTQQRFREAIDACNHAIRLAPDYVEAYDNLGLAYHAIGDIPHAIASFSRAINLTTKAGTVDAWPYINYAVMLEEHSPGSAIPLLKQAIAMDSQNVEANYQLGRSLRQAGRLTEAQVYFEKAIVIDPDFKAAYYALATLLRKENPEKSADLFRKFQALRDQNSAHDQTGASVHAVAP